MEFKKLLTLIICITALKIQAQSYSLSTHTNTYNSLTNSISLNNGAVWDDPQYTIPIDFSFQYFDSVLSSLTINKIGLGAALTDNPGEVGLTSMLIPYNADIIDRAYINISGDPPATGSLSNISYKLEGSTGTRILKIEWNNVGFYYDIEQNGSSTDFTNFQLWLYEVDNTIEIHFGPNSITNPQLVFDGNPGTSIFLLEEYNLDTLEVVGEAFGLTGNPTNPILETIDIVDDIPTNFLNSVIPNGTVFRFTNLSLNLEEFQVNSKIKFHPNPASDFISISGIKQPENYSVYSSLGNKFIEGVITKNTSINIRDLADGIYFLKFKNGNTYKFLKN